MAENTEVIEANEENFKKMLAEKDKALEELQQARKNDLIERAKKLGITKDLTGVNESGIKLMIEMAEDEKEKEEEEKTNSEPEKSEERSTKGMTVVEKQSYCPEWAKGPLKIQGKEMWREWDYDSFRG